MPPIAIWICGAVITIAISAVAAQSDARDVVDAARQESEAHASRDWAGRQVCNGRPFSWEDDKTLVCHQELP